MYFIINTTFAHASYFRKAYFSIYFLEILNIALLRMYFVSLQHWDVHFLSSRMHEQQQQRKVKKKMPLKLSKDLPVCRRKNRRYRTSVTNSAGGSLPSISKASQCFRIIKDCFTARGSMTNTTNNQATTCSPTIQWKCKASLAWFVCTGKPSWIEKYCLWAPSHLRNLAYFKHFFFSPKKCNLVIFTPLTSHFYCYQLTRQTTQHTVRALCSTLAIITQSFY